MLNFRYRKPGYVALNVTNLEKSVQYYRDLVGLQLEEQIGNEVAFLRCSDDHHNVVLYQSDVGGIKRMAFEMESEKDLDLLVEHVRAQGWKLREVPAKETAQIKQGRTFRFQIPEHTVTFEVYAHMERARGAFEPTVAQIQRLGHVVIRCAQRDAVLKTLTEKLNFKVSDTFGDNVAFLRCFPNPFHHSFGINRSDKDGVHHINFMVTNVDDVGKAMNRMKKAGVNVVYGPGRHDISNSIFIYFLDPDGMTTEYSFGMEEFPEVNPREPRPLPLKPEILDSWGGLPSAGFGSNGEIEAIEL